MLNAQCSIFNCRRCKSPFQQKKDALVILFDKEGIVKNYG